jgi:glycosyltransferase involved in cell wall biosynthesis
MNIANTFHKALPVLKSTVRKWQVILVNDGSRDNTGMVMDKIKAEYPKNIKIVTHNPNRGYGAAFKSGVYNSTYKWICLNDADGQFDFGDIKDLIQAQSRTGSDIIVGYYLGGRHDSIHRVLGSSMWQIAVFTLFGLRLKNIDCGFKLISKKVVDSIPKLEAERGPFITTEFLVKARRAGFKITEVGVHHFQRQGGKNTGANLNVVLTGLKDLLRLWVKINFNL